MCTAISLNVVIVKSNSKICLIKVNYYFSFKNKNIFSRISNYFTVFQYFLRDFYR